MDAGVYANANERVVPTVTVPATGGAPVVDRATAGGAAASEVDVVPIEVVKDNLDPEHEVYRGEANATTYTLTVTAAQQSGTGDVVVVDLVPADFQVGACDLGGADCTRRTVEVGGAVFTELTWNLGDLDPLEVLELRHTAVVGLQQITMPDGEADGAPTRPAGTGDTVTNTVTVTGSYAGATLGGDPAVSVTDTLDVTVLDVGVVKSGGGDFSVGGTTTFGLTVRTSEHVLATGVRIVDTVPDGMCPIVPAGTPVSGPWPAECPTTGGTVTGGTILSAVANTDGTFTVTFELTNPAATDVEQTITYPVYMRHAYTQGGLTSAGDTFVNRVEVTGTTAPAPGNTVDTGDVEVSNSSSADLGTSGLTLSKTVWSNPTRATISATLPADPVTQPVAGSTCGSAPAAEYGSTEGGPVLQLGDLVCFRIEIDFPDGVATRSAQLTDFLPPGTALVGWSAGPGNDDVTLTRVPSSTAWLLGDPGHQGTLVVPDGATTPDASGDPATATGEGEVAVTAVSSLTLAKEARTPVVNAGDVALWTIAVGNVDGPSDAAAPVVVRDTLPVGATYVSASSEGGPAQWSCEAGDVPAPGATEGQEVTCTLVASDGVTTTTLPAGASAPLLVIAATTDSTLEASVLTNGATATSPSSTGSPSDTADAEIRTRADLEIAKQHDAATPAVAGTPFTWSVTVTNRGPSSSVASESDPIRVRDVLPAGVTLAEAPASGGDATACEVVGEQDGREVVECLRTTTLLVGEQVTIDLHVALAEDLEGEVTNTVTVAPGFTPQPESEEPWPDEASDTVVITEIADLTIAKTVTTDPVVAGLPLSWEIAVTNLGPSNSDAEEATSITVTDTLPLGVTGAVGTGDGWTCAPGEPSAEGAEVLVCSRTEDLAVGAAPVITVTATVGAGQLADLTNTADVAPGLTQQPADGATDTAEVTAPVTTSADLGLTKVVAETIVAGAGGAYGFQITNTGPSDARDVVVTDQLPPGLTLVGSLTEGWECVSLDGDEGPITVCTLTGDDGVLAAGATAAFAIEVAAAADLSGDVSNTAVVSSSTPDPVAENNTATVVGTLAELADLAVTKTATGPAVVGQELVYELVVTNAGPSTARGVVLTDPLADSLTNASAAGEGWECTVNGTEVTCLLPELAPGESRTVTLTVLVGSAAHPAVANTAGVTAATPEDPETLGDNTATAVVDVPALTDVTIAKDVTTPLVEGGTGAYTLVVTNDGPTPEPGAVVVSDPLPSGLSLSGWSATGSDGARQAPATCVVVAGVVTCTIDGLALGESVSIVLEVQVAPGLAGTVVNTATVTAEHDPSPGSDSASTTVQGGPDLPPLGSDALGLAALALLLLAAGVYALRRRGRSGVAGSEAGPVQPGA